MCVAEHFGALKLLTRQVKAALIIRERKKYIVLIAAYVVNGIAESGNIQK